MRVPGIAIVLLFALGAAAASAQTPREAAQQGFAQLEARHFSRARALFTQSCEAGDPLGCGGLFQMHANGEGVPASRQQAMRFGRRACELGHPDVCVQLGRWAEPTDPTRAATLYGRACELRNSTGCASLGVLQIEGRGVPADAVEGRRQLTVACDARNQGACTNLAVHLINGPEGVRDAAAGRRLLTMACNAGQIRACSVLGMITRDGVGGPRQVQAAVPLFQRACEGGDADACLNLGSAYVRGEGVARNAERARVLFRQACDAGQQTACQNLEQETRGAGNAGAAPIREAAGEPRWSVRMGEVTLDGKHFRDVRSTCGLLHVTGLLQAIGTATGTCNLAGASPRLSVTLSGGRVTEASATPGGRTAQCIARRARRARQGSLSCRLEVTIGE